MTVAADRVIAAPLGEVWEVLVETRHWPEWGPTVTRVDGPARIVHGTTGRVRTPVGIWLPFEITEFDERHQWSWNVGGVGATGHRVERVERAGQDATRLTFTAPTWAVAYLPVLRTGLRRIDDIVTRRL